MMIECYVPDIVVDWLKLPKLGGVAPPLVYMVVHEVLRFQPAVSFYSVGVGELVPYTVTPPPTPGVVVSESCSAAPRGV